MRTSTWGNCPARMRWIICISSFVSVTSSSLYSSYTVRHCRPHRHGFSRRSLTERSLTLYRYSTMRLLPRRRHVLIAVLVDAARHCSGLDGFHLWSFCLDTAGQQRANSEPVLFWRHSKPPSPALSDKQQTRGLPAFAWHDTQSFKAGGHLGAVIAGEQRVQLVALALFDDARAVLVVPYVLLVLVPLQRYLPNCGAKPAVTMEKTDNNRGVRHSK